ncbi:MAG: D-alanine--D-alanine ligase family protein [Actinomycetaceae bacterium]|nr:D-alanine--D-alanine ligase family protein [Actinomycetaceae bacterium]
MRPRSGKTRVAIVFGGQSGEHTISCATAAGVLEAIDRGIYEPVPIGITREGLWVLLEDDPKALAMSIDGQGASVSSAGTTVSLWPGTKQIATLNEAGVMGSLGDVDVVMPLLHGPYGEDGTIQGLCETVGVPYTGCGVLASAAGMDKAVTKLILQGCGLPVGPYVVVKPRIWLTRPQTLRNQIQDLGMPVFVKPCRAGSSLGITKVERIEDLDDAIAAAQLHDPKVIVEAAIVGREIECAVLQGHGYEEPRVAAPGEVRVSTQEFYDFETKYVNHEGLTLLVPAPLSEEATQEVQTIAAAAFEALDCEGLTRVDFFYNEETRSFIINEVNTMPGLTPVSLYPKMWEHSGMTYTQLVSQVIELALERPMGLR